MLVQSNRLGRSIAIAVLVGLALLPQATPVAACSVGALDRNALPAVAEQASVIAVGTWLHSQERVALFRVDEPVKGTARGDAFVVDNRGTFALIGCDPYDEPFIEGGRFAQGERHIVFLQPGNVEDIWEVSYHSHAAFEIPGSATEPLETDSGAFQNHPSYDPPTYSDILSTSAGTTGAVLSDNARQWPQVIAASATIVILTLGVAAWRMRSLPRAGV